jgi:phosphopantothenoylcysteine decarboxylase / phosphopantothenate---cysteine ligase
MRPPHADGAMNARPAPASNSIRGRHIILGVSGGIAAYKSALVVRLLKQRGAEVQVMMTPDATRFISPLTLGTLSGRDVLIEIFPDDSTGGWTRHVHLGEWADILVIAPATAQTIAKVAHGFCDSMLTATVLSARCPVMVCPAMDHEMYQNPATLANLEQLRAFGYEVMPPEEGELASGITGIGRLPEPERIVESISEVLTRPGTDGHRDFDGLKVVITAGPTREAVDPVRYITNHSSGKMGYALAKAARARGADVVLVSGPVSLDAPAGTTRVCVETADEMLRAVDAHLDADVFIMAAAVSDYRPSEPSASKIKKTDTDFALALTRTPDILATVGRSRDNTQVVVGFALETDAPLDNARRKLIEKRCDMIVLNNPRDEGSGFGTDTNRITILQADDVVDEFPLLTKHAVAEEILTRAHDILKVRRSS